MAIKFEAEKDGHIISSSGNVTLELNYLSWNGYPAKYDLRRWNGDEPYKGITLNDEDVHSLLNIIAGELGQIVVSKEFYNTLIEAYEAKVTEKGKSVKPDEQLEHVRNCENCMEYRSENCAGLGLCENYRYSPTISAEELAMWPDMGDASYIRTHNGWGRR